MKKLFIGWELTDHHILLEATEDEIEVENFTKAQGWDEKKLGEHLAEEYVLFVMTNIPPPPKKTSNLDNSFWIHETKIKRKIFSKIY